MGDAVLITGASTGIGAAAAGAVADAGFTAFAGVRSEEAGAPIARDGVRPVVLDVTNDAQIAAAVDLIRASGLRLAGVVNNAGIFVGGPLEFLPLADLRHQFEVNVFGAMAVTQAVLPLLREAHGRIVFVGSISGRLSTPFGGPYAASKFALRALSEALRIELAPSGIPVTLIEPGAVKTPIWQKALARSGSAADLPANVRAIYGKALDALVASIPGIERRGVSTARTSAAILRALTAPTPPQTELVGVDAEIGSVLAVLPTSLRSLLFRTRLG
jgi:NAD(P)-dependent dehydrogenase (short-subunit alcohol dehydrogenase family)